MADVSRRKEVAIVTHFIENWGILDEWGGRVGFWCDFLGENGASRALLTEV